MPTLHMIYLVRVWWKESRKLSFSTHQGAINVCTANINLCNGHSEWYCEFLDVRTLDESNSIYLFVLG